jgi:hypothetical protein
MKIAIARNWRRHAIYPIYHINMKKLVVMKRFYGFIFLAITLFYSSCAVVESIFKAGVCVGVIIVVGIIGLIVWILSRFSRKG